VRDFNNIETRAVINLFSLQGKALKEIRTILTETLACFFLGRVKDLSASQYNCETPISILLLSIRVSSIQSTVLHQK
jgi:hypothetical protein